MPRATTSDQHVDPSDVVWRGSCRSPVFATIMVAGAVGAVAMCLIAIIALPLLIVAGFLLFLALLAAFTYKIVVTIDGDKMRMMWGLFRWPTVTVTLAEITAVRTDTIKPMQWGGWGYMMSAKGAAIIIRGGPAVVMDRRQKQTLAVTLPDADGAADTLNQLLTHYDPARPSDH